MEYPSTYGIALCHSLYRTIYPLINPKLQPAQIKQIILDARDEVLLIEPECIPLLNQFYEEFQSFLKYVIVLGDIQNELMAEFRFQFYEALINIQPECYDWQDIPEQRASGLCYTSGTTGQPLRVCCIRIEVRYCMH